MQLTRIISTGQTGAERAALDAAIELGIAHGGWIPAGRAAEDGPLPGGYRLEEMTSGGPAEAIEKNVREADGTVVFTRGPLQGGPRMAADLARRYGKPWLHIDLGRVHALRAAEELHAWTRREKVRVLHVAGARASEDPGIHNDVYQAVWGLFALDVMGPQQGPDAAVLRLEDLAQRVADRPATLAQAVDILEKHLPLEQKVRLSRMTGEELAAVHAGIGNWVRETFGLWKDNDRLAESIAQWRGAPVRSADEASAALVDALADRLRRTHRLRVVK